MIVSKKNFQEALKACAPLISSSPTIPILDHVAVYPGKIQATNLSISVEIGFNVTDDNEPFGGIAVPFKELSKVVDACGDFVQFSINGLELTAVSGRNRTTITGENITDFPKMLEGDPVQPIELIGEDLRYVASTVTKFASTDELRRAMCGVSFDGTKFAATDAHKLIHYTVDGDKTPEIIIPTKVFQVLSPIIAHEETVSVAGNRFRTENATVSFKSLDEKYPNWRGVLPEKHAFAEFNRAEMLQAVKFASVGSSEGTHQIILEAKGGQIKVSAEDTGFGKRAEAVIDGSGDFRMGVNHKFFTLGLQSTDDTRVKMYYSEPNRPVLLNSDDWQGEVLIMPVMIS